MEESKMSDVAIKRQLRRAKQAAMKQCTRMKYHIIKSDNSLFCFMAVRKMEIRMIRVIVGPIDERACAEIKAFVPPTVCSKEIWCWVNGHFEIIEIP